jgi:hypothetical protein
MFLCPQYSKPTSALDNQTEVEIAAAIDSLANPNEKGRATMKRELSRSARNCGERLLRRMVGGSKLEILGARNKCL